MHGRVKKNDSEGPDDQKKITEAKALIGLLLNCMNRGVPEDDSDGECTKIGTSLEVTSKILTFYPEFSTLWNERRSLLQSKSRCFGGNGCHPNDNGKSLDACNETMWLEECRMLTKTLEAAPKTYSAWHHRYWTFEQLKHLYLVARLEKPVAENLADLFAGELQLCRQLLCSDSRNFHVWTYRQQVLECLLRVGNGALVEEIVELMVQGKQSVIGYDSRDHGRLLVNTLLPGVQFVHMLNESFSRCLIEADFSNYSAWHLRTKVPFAGDTFFESPLIDPHKELDWVRQGLYTDPNDESVWQYYNWLVNVKLRPSIAYPNGLLAVRLLPVADKSWLVLLFSHPCVVVSNYTAWSPWERVAPAKWDNEQSAGAACMWRTDDYSLDVPFESQLLLFSISDSVEYREYRSYQLVLSEPRPGTLAWELIYHEEYPCSADAIRMNLVASAQQLKADDLRLLRSEVVECEKLLELEDFQCEHGLLFMHDCLVAIQDQEEEMRHCLLNSSFEGLIEFEKIQMVLSRLRYLVPGRSSLCQDLLEKQMFRCATITNKCVDLSNRNLERPPGMGHSAWVHLLLIERLTLAHNEISTASLVASGLGCLPYLRHLDLSHNRIADIEPVIDLLDSTISHLPARLLVLVFNPLATTRSNLSYEPAHAVLIPINPWTTWYIDISNTPLAVELQVSMPLYLQDKYTLRMFSSESECREFLTTHFS